MTDDDDHDLPAARGPSVGIARVGTFDGAAFERAVADLLQACGMPTDGVHTGQTPRRVRELGYEIGNVDSTVIAQAPRLAPHRAAMCQGLARALGVGVDQLNVKAKTAEKLGPVGQGLAIEARATVLLYRRPGI